MNNNVDEKELIKFSAHQQQWWQPNGELRTLHDINPLRVNWIKANVALTDLQIVDVGCGGGILAEALAKAGAKHVLGIDLAQGALAAAKQHAAIYQIQNLTYQNIAVEQLAQQQPASFDVVTALEMLEHVPDPLSVVQSCAKLVKSGGWVFFSTISRSIKSKLLVVYAAEYLLKMLPKGTHQAEKFINPSELAYMCRQSGLEVMQIQGMTYYPLQNDYQLTSDTSLNYLLATRKISN